MALQTFTFDLQVPNPDTDKKYCWVSIEIKEQWMKYAWMGYTPVSAEMAHRIFGEKLAKMLLDEHGYVRFREMVLCYIADTRWAEIQYHLAKENADRRQLPEKQFMEMVDALGPSVKAFHMTKAEYDDRREHDTRESQNRVSYAGLDPKAIYAEAAKIAAEAAKQAVTEAVGSIVRTVLATKAEGVAKETVQNAVNDLAKGNTKEA